MRRWDPLTPFRALAELPGAVGTVLAGTRRAADDDEKVGAIVLLGAAVLPGGEPSASLRARVDGALAAWRAGRAPIIVCTGAHHLHPPGEAVVAAGLLREAGVPEAAIVLEEKSRTTEGNLSFARALLPPEVVRVLVVTEPFHMGRALEVARRVGFDPLPWPVASRAWARPAARARWVARDIGALALYRASLSETGR